MCECACGRLQLFPRAITKPTYRGRKCCDYCRGSICVICGERILQTSGRVAKTCCPEHAGKYASKKEKKRYQKIKHSASFLITRAIYIGKLKRRYSLEPGLYLTHSYKHRLSLHKHRSGGVSRLTKGDRQVASEDKKELKEAYLEALSIAQIVLKYLHKANDNTLDKWMYVPDRYPTFVACYELWMFIRKTKQPISRKLHRLIVRSQTRANEAFAKFNEKTELSIGNTSNRYIFIGDRLTMRKIAELLKVSMANVGNHIKQAERQPEDDVSDLPFIRKNKWFFPVRN